MRRSAPTGPSVPFLAQVLSAQTGGSRCTTAVLLSDRDLCTRAHSALCFDSVGPARRRGARLKKMCSGHQLQPNMLKQVFIIIIGL